MPEGAPYASSNYPNPDLRRDYITKLGNKQDDVQGDETKRRHTEDQKEQAKQENINKTRKERNRSPAERQGDIATSCPGAKRRQKRWGKGDGRWVWSKHIQAHQHKDFAGHYLNEWDGKLALAQGRTPSRGEPGELRRFRTYQRTPSPKLGGKET